MKRIKSHLLVFAGILAASCIGSGLAMADLGGWPTTQPGGTGVISSGGGSRDLSGTTGDGNASETALGGSYSMAVLEGSPIAGGGSRDLLGSPITVECPNVVGAYVGIDPTGNQVCMVQTSGGPIYYNSGQWYYLNGGMLYTGPLVK
jgi:hypothetical protein